MLAQLFNPTEIKKNGPAARPAIAPTPRAALPFNAAWGVLAGTAQEAIATQMHRQSMPVESVVHLTQP
jgi:hypothetical protein